MFLYMCIVLASIGSTECKSPNGYVTISDPFMFVESVEPRCLFTKFLLCYESTWSRQKQTKHAFSLLKKDDIVTRQTVVH